MTIKDPEVRILAGISLALQAEYQSENREWWARRTSQKFHSRLRAEGDAGAWEPLRKA